MQKLEEFLLGLAAFGLCVCFCGLTACGATANSNQNDAQNGSQSNSQSESQSSSDSGASDSDSSGVTTKKIELVEYFSDGEHSQVTLGCNAEVETTYNETGAVIGNANTQTITIDGGEDMYTLTATGGGVGEIKAANNGTLVFKNLCVRDMSLPSSKHNRRPGYLEFGGNLRFENCDFECSILLMTDADANFVNCSFKPQETKMYGVWVSDGSVIFKGCEFTGVRALKIHEELGKEVVSVTVEGCLFSGITEKPGVAIGTICNYPQDTTVAVKNSTFESCVEFTLVEYGAGEGYDGFYESDTPTEQFNFILENNLIDGYEYDPTLVERRA